jgi:hypothetical protein
VSNFLAIDLLTNDQTFMARVRACALEQSESFKSAALPSYVSLANDQMTGGITYLSFVRIASAAPGFADKADNGEGGIDQSNVPDADILSSVQNNWPTVAPLWFKEDGTPV